jgi:hypothetical protein
MKTHMITASEKVAELLEECLGKDFSILVKPMKKGEGLRVVQKFKDGNQVGSNVWDFTGTPATTPSLVQEQE